MKRGIVIFVLAAVAATFSFAQTQAQSSSPVAKQPQAKSQEEVTAIQAIFMAPDADSRIKAAQDLVTKFADTEFKSLAYLMIASSYEEKGDADNAIAWAEKLLEVDPANFQGKLLIAGELARRTREHDLDREEKLSRAESLLKSAQEDIQKAPRPRPDVTDEQWAEARKMVLAQSYEVGGMIALARKNYAAAIEQFKRSVEGSPQPEPVVQVRLAAAYNLAGQNNEALSVLNQVLASANLHPAVKAAAEQEKQKAEQALKK